MQQQGGVDLTRRDVTRSEYSNIQYFENEDHIAYTGFRKDGSQDTCFYIKKGLGAGRKRCHNSTFNALTEEYEPQALNVETFDYLKSLYNAAKARQ